LPVREGEVAEIPEPCGGEAVGEVLATGFGGIAAHGAVHERRIAGGERVPIVPLVPHQGEAAAGPQDPPELAEGSHGLEPVEGLGTHDEVHVGVGQARRLRRRLAHDDPRVGGECRAHGGVRLDREHAHALLGEEPRRDAGARADVRRDERRGRAEPAEDGGHGISRIVGPRPRVVARPNGEAALGVLLPEGSSVALARHAGFRPTTSRSAGAITSAASSSAAARQERRSAAAFAFVNGGTRA
jgi:hypothetical protein